MNSYATHVLSLVVGSALFLLSIVVYAFICGARLAEFFWVPPLVFSLFLSCLAIFSLAAVFIYARELRHGVILFIRKESTAATAREMLQQISQRVDKIYDEAITFKRLKSMSAFLFMSACMFVGLSIEKSLIVHSVGYRLDSAISAFDKSLHLGIFPHEILTPFVEGAHLINVLNIFYYAWFGVLMLAVWCASYLKQDQRLRLQFWWTLLAMQIFLGTIMAHGLATVGPIYYADFYPGDHQPYASFLSHLRDINDHQIELQSFRVSGVLLMLCQNASIVDINGISAMPSMHVALAALFFLYFRHYGRWMAVLSFLFLLAIMIGSVYFAWHYAVDGYAGIIGTVVLWYGIGIWLKRQTDLKSA